MYRLLSRRARAPLPAMARAIRRFDRSDRGPMEEWELDLSVTQVLHEHGWRKGDYLRALRRRAHSVRRTQHVMRKRPFCP
jgi:hypothetical protein